MAAASGLTHTSDDDAQQQKVDKFLKLYEISCNIPRFEDIQKYMHDEEKHLICIFMHLIVGTNNVCDSVRHKLVSELFPGDRPDAVDSTSLPHFTSSRLAALAKICALLLIAYDKTKYNNSLITVVGSFSLRINFLSIVQYVLDLLCRPEYKAMHEYDCAIIQEEQSDITHRILRVSHYCDDSKAVTNDIFIQSGHATEHIVTTSIWVTDHGVSTDVFDYVITPTLMTGNKHWIVHKNDKEDTIFTDYVRGLYLNSLEDMLSDVETASRPVLQH